MQKIGTSYLQTYPPEQKQLNFTVRSEHTGKTNPCCLCLSMFHCSNWAFFTLPQLRLFDQLPLSPAETQEGKTCCGEREGGWCESPVEKAGVIFSVGPALKPLRAALCLWRCRGLRFIRFSTTVCRTPRDARWTDRGRVSLVNCALFVWMDERRRFYEKRLKTVKGVI